MKPTTDRHGPCHTTPVAPDDEFAPGASSWFAALDEPTRRAFMKRMAAGIALATGAVGCSSRPEEQIVPRADANDSVVPAKPIAFATTLTLSGYGRGAIAISREGRPIKIEGNPDHPSNLGGTDPFMQAAILDLYDPTRSNTPTFAGNATGWPKFTSALSNRLAAARADGGARLRLLLGNETSPTLVAQLAEFERAFPNARWHLHDPLARRAAHHGAELSFGRPVSTVYDFSKARAIVSLDADFLFELPGNLRYARDFSDGRRVRAGHVTMNRLYIAESTLSLAGSMADHRRAVRPSDVRDLANRLGAACGLNGESTSDDPWIRAAANDLRANRGASLVIVGDSQPPDVHMIVHAINDALGNLGTTVRLVEPIELRDGGDSRSLATLVGDMDRGAVDTLVILGGDPAYSASGDVDFAGALERFSKRADADGTLANFSCHLGQRTNATSFRTQWHVPEAHELESWGDARGHDGTASLVQPLIAPLHGARTKIELLDALLGRSDRSGLEAVRAQWRTTWGDADFETRWQQSLTRGTIEGSAPAAVDARFEHGRGPSAFLAGGGGIEVVLRPDPSAWDGSFFANAWLQELPRPFTKIVWDNAALIGPSLAAQHGLSEGDGVRIAVGDRAIELPIAILPGTPDGTVTLHLGYGQDGDSMIGASAYGLRNGYSRYAANATLTKLDKAQPLVTTRNRQAMSTASATPPTAALDASDAAPSASNRRLARVATLDAFRADPEVIAKLGGEAEKKPLLSLYPEWDYSKGYQWGMSIDTGTCIGCNACIVACQAENNIPVVGKEQVGRQREMHWLRVDTYADADADRFVHQPVPCMHCENAPCEVVCPVAATTHSVEGLNQMTYNRCVGTRYCSNNCPYKVRRFNFFNYTSQLRESTLKLAMNPEVTVRARGVMEKCSFCIQRLQQTRIEVERATLDLSERARRSTDEPTRSALAAEAKRLEFDAIERLDTACAQACPTHAITFGSIRPVAGRATEVMAEKAQPHDYVLLRELTTKPRVSYLGKIVNPDASIAGGHA